MRRIEISKGNLVSPVYPFAYRVNVRSFVFWRIIRRGILLADEESGADLGNATKKDSIL